MIWTKSGYSNSSNNCVEVVLLPTQVAVRDSKDLRGPVLWVEAATWTAFLQSVTG